MLPLLQDISNLRAAIGGGADAGITSPAASGLYIPYVAPKYFSVIIPTDSNGLAFARTVSEVRQCRAAQTACMQESTPPTGPCMQPSPPYAGGTYLRNKVM